jgi:hypothetical protein
MVSGECPALGDFRFRAFKPVMTRALLLSAAFAVTLSAFSAHAAEPSKEISATFGNTVMSVYPDGRSQKIWLQSDGTWTGHSRRGNPLAGKWTVKGEQVCLHQAHPFLPGSFCQTLPSDPAAGIDSKDMAGTPIHLKLVKGHVEQ